MVYVFLADGFEEIEAITPVDVLRRGGIDVKTVGVGNIQITGAHGIPVVCDVLASDIDFTIDADIVLPGGMPGTLNLAKSAVVEKAIKNANNNSRLIAAICAAPSVLGSYGILKGKKATCYPGFEDQLIDAEVLPVSVCQDGNIITARGAGVAFEFAAAILSYLTGDPFAGKKIGESMQCAQ